VLKATEKVLLLRFTAFGTCRPRMGKNNRHVVVIDDQ
jgi:hypothetical protein